MDLYWKKAWWLSIITIAYNIIEGLVSIYFGIKDESLSLFGFGVDSFIETISASGILIMIIRVNLNNQQLLPNFETLALKITAICFFALSLILIYSAVMNIIHHEEPTTTLPGIIITLLSIVFTYFIIRTKIKVGEHLQSNAIISDAKCGMVCIYLSIIVLIASFLFEVFRIAYIDAIGALGVAYYSVKEGIEAFKKAKNPDHCCDEC